MNTLADTLAQHNLTTEDIEKAASVRIFAKVAAAENIDLSQLTEPQIDELYAHFEANVLPGILSGNAAEPSTEQKIASLTQPQLFELFDKQASAEGLDFSNATDEQLANAFGYFLENVLPAMAENGFEPVGAEKSAEAEKSAAVEEARAKLAEADILGRQMARSWVDEVQKLAAYGGDGPGHRGVWPAVQAKLDEQAAKAPGVGRRALDAIKAHPGRAAGIAAGTLAAGAGAAALRSHLKKKDEGKESTAGVALSPEDVEILNHLASTGDTAGLQKAASLIVKAAGFVPFGKKDEKAEDKKKDAEKSEDEKKADADAMLDTLVESRAAELAAGWLTENGYAVAGE